MFAIENEKARTYYIFITLSFNTITLFQNCLLTV